MNNFNNNFGSVMPNNQTPPQVRTWLSPEQLALLNKGVSKFNLSVSDEDMAVCQCNHVKTNGQSALIPDNDGSNGYTCSMCGTHFYMRQTTKEEVKINTDYITDVLNTIKVMYLSLDPSMALQFFQIIPFIQKIPDMYEIAMNDLRKYDSVGNFIDTNGTANPFNLFNSLTNPGYNAGFAGMQGQQNFGGGFQNQQAGVNPMYGSYGQPGMVNPNMATMNAPFQQNQGVQYANNVASAQQQAGQLPQQSGYTPNQSQFSLNAQGAAGGQAPTQQSQKTDVHVAPAPQPPVAAKADTKQSGDAPSVNTKFKK